ncbi:MAG: hypothetical protein PUF65_11135 [Lachnospiraceae bacterium]|nr:hypothetical protein [Lachnospiraceae bacterium]
MLKKKGLIYCPNGEHEWEKDTFMTPHAMVIEPGIIRIWGGTRDSEGVSRIKYIDVDENDPRKILKISDRVSLDVGNPGCFDDNGVILGDVLRVGNQIYMYYVGFQHVQKVKFYAFSGLAISSDNGESFKRYSETPILDRTTTGRFGRCIHTVLYDQGVFRCYYAIINDWKYINNIPYPVYDIWYTESKDGIHFENVDRTLCVTTENDEYRIGRPKVYKTENGYEMFYTRDLVTKDYIVGRAVSKDGIVWTRCDDSFVIEKSAQGWDSEMACYPVKLKTSNNTYIFYNGNGMGKTGVGYIQVV